MDAHGFGPLAKANAFLALFSRVTYSTPPPRSRAFLTPRASPHYCFFTLTWHVHHAFPFLHETKFHTLLATCHLPLATCHPKTKKKPQTVVTVLLFSFCYKGSITRKARLINVVAYLTASFLPRVILEILFCLFVSLVKPCKISKQDIYLIYNKMK